MSLEQCPSDGLIPVNSLPLGKKISHMHLQHLILHNLVQKSKVLQDMVESSDSDNHFVVETEFIFSYTTYDDLTLKDVLDGFSLTLEEVTYVAFGIFDKRGQRAADLLQCVDYAHALIDLWIRKESPWKPEAFIHLEILTNPTLNKRWLKKLVSCIERNDADAVRRLWIDTPQAIDLWKSVRNYNAGLVFVEKKVPISGRYIQRLIHFNQTDLLEALLRNKHIDANGIYNRHTFLMIAVLKRKGDIVKLFLDYGANPHTVLYGLSALSCAETQVSSYKIYNILLSYIDKQFENSLNI